MFSFEIKELSSNMALFMFSLVQSFMCFSEEETFKSSVIKSVTIPVNTQFDADFHVCSYEDNLKVH
jgi:hypothetical protein